MTRTVADAAILLGALIGADKTDAITSQSSKGKKNYTRFLQKDGLKNARIGVARQFPGKNPKIDALIEPHLQALKDGGATLIDITFPTVANFGDDELEILLYEFKANISIWHSATRRIKLWLI